MRWAILPIALLGLPASLIAQPACTKAPAGAETAFFVEPAPARAGDTVIVARLCMVSRRPVGSYAATLTYDSTRMVVVQVSTSGGMQATNSRVPGTIRIAGAAPNGYANGVLATMTFRGIGSRTLGRIAIAVTEVNTTTGTPIGPVKATGWPALPEQLPRPTIDSISPRSGEITHERVTDIVLYGRNFASDGNIVMFGGAEISGLVSDRAGTVLRFTAPTTIPTRTGVQSRRIEPGRIEVRVRHAGGSSNAVSFLVKGGS